MRICTYIPVSPGPPAKTEIRRCWPYQAARKGIRYLGTGDFTHPAWREELKEKLEPAEQGLYRLKKEYRIPGGEVPGQQEPRFVVSGEISSIYKKDGKTRKVHSLILLPGLEEAEELFPAAGVHRQHPLRRAAHSGPALP